MTHIPPGHTRPLDQSSWAEDLAGVLQRWAKRNLPAYTCNTHEAVLADLGEKSQLLANSMKRNMALVRELADLQETHRALRERHVLLQNEVCSQELLPPLRCSASASYDLAGQSPIQHVTLRYELDPYRATLAIPLHHTRRNALGPHHLAAFEEFFHREYTPKLWQQARAALETLALSRKLAR